MRKGAKKNKEESSEEQDPVEEQDDNEEDIEEFSDSQQNLLDEDEDEDQQLLKKIQDEIMGSQENIKLTWAAVYALKQEQKALNEQMDDQMRKIKAKYDQIKKPLFAKISKVVSGDKVEKQLYNKHELTKSLNLKKFTPAKIPGFWVSVFESVGLLGSEQDKKIFESCAKVECQSTIDDQKDQQTIRIVLHFDENQYFTNKQLKLSVSRKVTSVEIVQVSRIQFKKPLQGQITLKDIFNPLADAYKLYEHADDIQRAYNQSIFFYFFESRIDQDLDEEQQEDQEDQDGQQEQDDEQDSEQEQNIGKPVKRRKPNVEKNIQKPECNNQ